LLTEAVMLPPDVEGPIRYAPVAIQGAVLFVGMLLQTFVCKEADAANPPVAFAVGVVLGFLPPLVAGFALFVAVMAAFGVRSVGAFFPILAISVVAAGLLFSQFKLDVLSLVALAGAMMAPWL